MVAMEASAARQVFDDALDGETDPDRIARVELLREFFCNAEFRAFILSDSFRRTSENRS